MEEHDLGPNGSLVYCMEFLLANHEWLLERIEEVTSSSGDDDSANINYIIFDCPGQVKTVTCSRFPSVSVLSTHLSVFVYCRWSFIRTIRVFKI
jgi:hypothetical protein